MAQLSCMVAAPVLVLITALGHTVATAGMKLVSQDIIGLEAAFLALGLLGSISA